MADASLLGVGGGPVRPWTVLRGRDVSGGLEVVLNEYTSRRLGVEPDATITVRATCARGAGAPPPVGFRVVGIAEFPFDTPGASEAGTTASALAAACGAAAESSADFLIVTSTGDADAAAAEIAALRPDLRPFTNDQAISQMERGGFTYFRQISTVLTTVTLSFALLLITVLLTVSVNQRLGDIAALRALGFTRGRVVADVLSESGLIVGIGGVLSLPLGALLAVPVSGALQLNTSAAQGIRPMISANGAYSRLLRRVPGSSSRSPGRKRFQKPACLASAFSGSTTAVGYMPRSARRCHA